MARASALEVPVGRGFILHTTIVLINRNIPVTMVRILWTYSTIAGYVQAAEGNITPLQLGQ